MSRPAVIMMIATLGFVWGGFVAVVILGISRERRKRRADDPPPPPAPR